MIYRNLSMIELIDMRCERTLICFGAGKKLTRACEDFADISFFDRIDLIADNNKEKYIFSFEGKEKSVASISTCLKLAKKDPIILITMDDCMDVIEQLDNIPALNNCSCFYYLFVYISVAPYSLSVNRAERKLLRIPKIIHYCWFGGKPLRDEFKEYIETWKKYCPDYEIVRWDESNFDYKRNEYMYEAYKHKKWSFVSDFARLDAIYRYGGVYLDTDVELVRNIDDLLYDDAFCGFEDRKFVNNGLGFGAVSGFPIIRDMMKTYDDISFVNRDGTLNLMAGPEYQTHMLRELGLKMNNTLQEIQGMKIYPSDVLSATNLLTREIAITNNTYAIHHYAATWYSDAQSKEQERLNRKYARLADIFLRN